MHKSDAAPENFTFRCGHNQVRRLDMKKINNIFDCLENAEGSEMERITNKTPQLDDKQLERILDMSERKYNIKKRNEIKYR